MLLGRNSACCSRVLQCVVVRHRVLQCVATSCSVLQRQCSRSTQLSCAAPCPNWNAAPLLPVLQCVANKVCCSVLQCAAVCCSMLQYAAVWRMDVQCVAVCRNHFPIGMRLCCLHCVTLCCIVLQCGAMPCSALQYVAVCCIVLQGGMLRCIVLQSISHWQSALLPAVCCFLLRCVAACCMVVQCVAVWCSVLQYVAACCRVVQCVAVCHHNCISGMQFSCCLVEILK